MSDSGSGRNQFVSEMGQTAKEVAKDVKDAVGEMIEQGVQSVAGPTLTPQQIQQKQAEDQKNLAEARRKIAWFKNIDEAQKTVRLANQQKEQQKQVEKQEKVEKVQQTQVKQTKANEQALEAQRRAAAELKAGKGIGG